MNLWKPSKEETDKMIENMVAQVHSTYNLKNRMVNNVVGNALAILIKDMSHKINNEKKLKYQMVVKVKDVKVEKWEPKKNMQTQNAGLIKISGEEKKPKHDIFKKVEDSSDQVHENKGNPSKPIIYDHVDMINMFPQITMKVPLSEMFRIEEHKKNPSLGWEELWMLMSLRVSYH